MTDVPILSGNEITDVTRRNNTQGDGLLPEQGSTGIWEATTNLITNGGFETNAAGWFSDVGGAVNRSTARSKFGSACGSFTKNGIANTNTGYTTATTSLGLIYSMSVWMWIPKDYSGTEVRFSHEGGLSGTQYEIANLDVRDQWQKIVIENRTAAGASIFVVIRQVGASNGDVVYCDGVQVEQQPIATPYVETDGATATRSASRATIPSMASYASNTQGWLAMRVRFWWDSATEPTPYPTFFGWFGTGFNRILVFYDSPGNLIRVGRDTTAFDEADVTLAFAPSYGSIHTLIGSWTATQVGISLDGSAFTTFANTIAPTLATDAYIGDFSNVTDLDYYWFAAGSGTLTDADAKRIAGFNNDPKMADFPGTPTWFWDSGPDGRQVPLVLGQLGTGRV